MGYRGQQLDGGFLASVENAISEIRQLMRPAAVKEIFPLTRGEGGLLLTGTELVLTGRSIAKLLSDSVKCCVMAATIGIDVDRQIRRLSVSGLTDSVIFDACATAAIEAVCDAFQAEIEEAVREEGYRITSRFSPGYGDFPLDIQGKLLRVLQAEKRCGITLTSSGLMVPCKSVSAVFGLEACEKQHFD